MVHLHPQAEDYQLSLDVLGVLVVVLDVLVGDAFLLDSDIENLTLLVSHSRQPLDILHDMNAFSNYFPLLFFPLTISSPNDSLPTKVYTPFE